GESDSGGVQFDLADLEPQSLSQGPESPEPPRTRHPHRVGLPGGVLPIHQTTQEGIALGLSRQQALTMVREQVVREVGEALLAVQIEGEVVAFGVDPEDDTRSELREEFLQYGEHQQGYVTHHA